MIKNDIKLALNNRPPIEEFYREGIANNTIRYKEIPYARQKFFGTLIFGVIIILVFQYQVFPYVNSLSKNCQLWQGIDLTFILFYFIFVFPLFFAFLIFFPHLFSYFPRSPSLVPAVPVFNTPPSKRPLFVLFFFFALQL